MLLTFGFKASNSYLNNLMYNHMQLRCREISSKRIAAPLTDEVEAKHRLVLLRLAWLVWHYAIPPSLVASRDQSGVMIFPQRSKRRADKGSKQVPGIEANDKRAVTIEFAITADGQVIPPQGLLMDP